MGTGGTADARNEAAARRVEVDDLAAIKSIPDVHLSADGMRVGYSLVEMDPGEDLYRSAIWAVPTGGGSPVQFTAGRGRDTAPRWSPDGRWLAFLSDRDGDVPQLYVMPADGGEPRRLTVLPGGAGPAAWSPDGTRMAFAARVSSGAAAHDDAGLDRRRRSPRVVTRAQYKADGQGYTLDAPSQLFVLCVATGAVVQLTHGECDNTAPAWSPDGGRLAFGRSRAGRTDYGASDIWIVGADGGYDRCLTRDVGHAASPSWSPDGGTIACFGTEDRDPGFGESTVRVWAVPVSGGRARPLTAGFDRSAVLPPWPAVPPGPAWSADGASVLLIVADGGHARIVRAAASGGTVTVVVGGDRQTTSLSAASGSGQIAFAATDWHAPSDLFVCGRDGSGERRLTSVNAERLGRLALPAVERRVFERPEGAPIDGWLMRPARADGPAPLLVEIHGGPHSYHGNGFPLGAFHTFVLASRGWAVLALNPTGSGSYGQGFARGIRGRWGEQDLPEQLAAIDLLIAEGVADPERLAVSGYSYGGFMAAWAITHTDRFKAAVVGAPVVNLESFHGTSDIGMWFSPSEMSGDIRNMRETYRRLSPANYLDRVRTPTLIVHGEADDRCPIGQGEELFIGLLAAGRARAEMVRYPGESHLFRTIGLPSHRLDLNRRIVEWVERYTLGPERA